MIWLYTTPYNEKYNVNFYIYRVKIIYNKNHSRK